MIEQLVGGLRTLSRSTVYEVSMERGNKEKLGVTESLMPAG